MIICGQAVCLYYEEVFVDPFMISTENYYFPEVAEQRRVAMGMTRNPQLLDRATQVVALGFTPAPGAGEPYGVGRKMPG